MNGVINIYKERGFTSHDVVAIVKRLFRGEKVGHAGTLDPDAEGALIVLLGKGTKLSDYIMSGEKEYRAEITFGAVTDTYDHTGKILEESVPRFSESALADALAAFCGTQMQTPPMYSAIKVNGKKLYELARAGQEIERKQRQVTISAIDLVSFNGKDVAVVDVRCSKGTYIRSLCHDIGQSLGCGAHMSALTRTRTGAFLSADGVRLDTLKAAFESGGQEALAQFVLPMAEALAAYPRCTVKPGMEKLLYNGGKIFPQFFETENPQADIVVVYDAKEHLVGIYEAARAQDTGKVLFLKPRTMLSAGENDELE